MWLERAARSAPTPPPGSPGSSPQLEFVGLHETSVSGLHLFTGPQLCSLGTMVGLPGAPAFAPRSQLPPKLIASKRVYEDNWQPGQRLSVYELRFDYFFITKLNSFSCLSPYIESL